MQRRYPASVPHFQPARDCLAALTLLLTACPPDGDATPMSTSTTTGEASASTSTSTSDPPTTSTTTESTTSTTAPPTTTTDPATDPTTDPATTDASSSTGDLPPEQQPPPAEGAGLSDPASNTLHNHGCGGTDWQRIHGWLLLPYAAPEIGPPAQMARCVERYAGWVTNEADAAMVSRASVYAVLAASGQCEEDTDYIGGLVTGPQCTSIHPDLSETDCLAQVAGSRAFGITTLAQALGHPDALAVHDRDLPLMAAYIGHGAVECGGDDRWQLLAPPGYIDRFVAAYNAYKALSSEPPACSKRIVVSFALYTGLDDPGAEGVTAANGCWTYERIAKTNNEWKICNYDGTVVHPGGVKWVYDDTSSNHSKATEQANILACQKDVPGRGYVYMTNRGSGWPKVVTEDVELHFAEIYSGQFAVDDQFNAWKADGAPGDPMINFGEPTTSATTIASATAKSCAEVADGHNLGVYVYPESLRTARMGALVKAVNSCTGAP